MRVADTVKYDVDNDNLGTSSGVDSYGALGHVHPPRLLTVSFLVHFGVNLTANYPRIV